MKTHIFYSLLLLSFVAHSQESFVGLDKEKYMPGDTLALTCNLEAYKKDSIRFATVYLLAEHINTGRKWTYRYPLIEGKVDADLLIDTSLPTGNYALTFITRKRFFNIRGIAKDKKNTKLNYSVLTKNEATHSGSISTDKNGYFNIQNVLFEDTCYFVFTSEGRQDLKMNMVTILDSTSFNIDRQQTKFITIGNMPSLSDNEKTAYKITMNAFFGKMSLPDVIVSTKKKSKVDLFNEEYSKGLFKNGHSLIFDGLDDPRIGASVSVFEFLRGRVAGLIVTNKLAQGINSRDMTGNAYSLAWRGEGIDVFLDEFLLTEIGQNTINPQDVAMIKIFQPPSYLRPASSRGAIAIYTKKGTNEMDNNGNIRFRIFGYTPAEYIWK